jgi:hypothetical protein
MEADLAREAAVGGDAAAAEAADRIADAYDAVATLSGARRLARLGDGRVVAGMAGKVH